MWFLTRQGSVLLYLNPDNYVSLVLYLYPDHRVPLLYLDGQIMDPVSQQFNNCLQSKLLSDNPTWSATKME